MGLGLAISRRLLQGMGGKIWVESEPGSGCKFSFLIPMKPILSSPPKEPK
jgi:signal transduction histidine kinase